MITAKYELSTLLALLIFLVLPLSIMEQQLNKQLDIHLNKWVENSQSLSWSLTGKPFFNVAEDSEVTVNLLLLSESYRTKHIDSKPGNYCNQFLYTLEPFLALFLQQHGIAQYEFRFKFLMIGTTRKQYLVKAA